MRGEKLKNSEEKPDNILQSTDIVCLARDAKGNMWVGTNGGGISCTTGKDSEGCWLFENFNANYKLPSEEIKGLTFDNRGNVWFDTDHNICSFDTSKRIFATYSNLEGVDETIISEASGHHDVQWKYPVWYRQRLLRGGPEETGDCQCLDAEAAHHRLLAADDEIQSPRLTDTSTITCPTPRRCTYPATSPSSDSALPP